MTKLTMLTIALNGFETDIEAAYHTQTPMFICSQSQDDIHNFIEELNATLSTNETQKDDQEEDDITFTHDIFVVAIDERTVVNVGTGKMDPLHNIETIEWKYTGKG